MDKLNSKHFAFFILATGIVSLKTYPGIFMKNGGRESWVAMIIASVLIFAFFAYIINVCQKIQVYNLRDLYQKAAGKALGDIFISIYIATLFATLIESASAEANSMHTNMLLETPAWYLLLFFVVPIIYTIRREIVAITTVTMIGIVLIMLAGINLGILTAKYKDLNLLFPVFQDGIKPGFFIAAAKMLGLYGGISITLPYLKMIKRKEKLIKHSIVGLIIVIQMEIVSVTGVISTFGPVFANQMPYPKLIQTQHVSYLKFLEFGELYVMLQILGGWMLKYLLAFYGMLIVLKSFGLKRNQLIWITYIASLLVFVISYFVSKNLFVLFGYFNIYSYICLFNFVIIPFAMFAIASLRSKKGEKTGKSV